MSNSNEIPELKPYIKRYGCSLKSKPQFLLIGFIPSSAGNKMGILCYSNNEFHANILKREINNLGGECSVERSEYHQSPTVSTKIYRQEFKKFLERKSNG